MLFGMTTCNVGEIVRISIAPIDHISVLRPFYRSAVRLTSRAPATWVPVGESERASFTSARGTGQWPRRGRLPFAQSLGK